MDGEPEYYTDTGTICNHPASVSEAMSDYNQARQDSLEKKAVHLRLTLEKDFKAADIKWSLFVAAAFSFRYESVLRPFPPAFLKNGLKDMDDLLRVITDVPALDLVLQQLDHLENLTHISEIIDLLFFVLVRLKDSTLRSVPLEAHGTILSNAGSTHLGTKPHFIFQVVNSNKSIAEAKWKELSKSYQNVFYAYHGNRLENFYSIINFGFQLHSGKNANTDLKNGIYLSSALSECLPYSYGGFGWGASCIAGHLSCVALCEVIDAPEGINYQKPASTERFVTKPNMGDGVFEDEKKPSNVNGQQPCHYVVKNPDLVRVRYLLVYAKQATSMRFRATANANRGGGGGLRFWFSRHKLFSILLGYGLMLATIGFANNQPINYYYNILLKKLDKAFGH